jgi:hypothetical protein
MHSTPVSNKNQAHRNSAVLGRHCRVQQPSQAPIRRALLQRTCTSFLGFAPGLLLLWWLLHLCGTTSTLFLLVVSTPSSTPLATCLPPDPLAAAAAGLLLLLLLVG